MTAPEPGRWPLSAPATALLLDEKTADGELLRLALRQLVLGGTWRLHTDPPKRGLLGGEKVQQPQLLPGPMDAPPALQRLDLVLRQVAPRGGQVRKVVPAALKAEKRLAKEMRATVLAELRAHGLLGDDRVRGLLRPKRTSSGEAWKATAERAHTAWRSGLPAAAGAVAVAEAVASPGLLLAGDRSVLDAIDAQFRSAFSTSGEVGAAMDSQGFAGLGDAFDGLRGLGDLSFGVSDSGWGGDGGGGDGGGGGE